MRIDKRFRALSAALAATMLFAASCEAESVPAKKQTSTIFAMDTVMELTVYGQESDLSDAESLIRSLEGKLSVTDESSEIYALNSDKTAVVSSDTAEIISQALSLCDRTDGVLDVTIYPVLQAWGFTTGNYRVPEQAELETLLSRVDFRRVAVDGNTVSLVDNMEIDLGSVAKGYTGDKIISLLREKGVKSALLNLGGNVQALGAKEDGSPWRIAVADPNGDGYAGCADVEDKCVITSGGYERYFEESGTLYHHIIDPATGAPAESGLSSVTIVGESGITCDALSTALFIMGLERGIDFWRVSSDFDAVFITDDGNIYITEGLESCFTALNGADVTVVRRDEN